MTSANDVRLLVQKEDIGSALEQGVSGRKTGETTTDDDNLGHFRCAEGRGGGEGLRKAGEGDSNLLLYKCR